MNRLYINGSSITPNIDFNPAIGTFEISGKSIPEDSVGFYAPVIEWIEEYAISPLSNTVVCIKLEYFNTSSSKVLLDILYLLEKIENIVVEWYYDEDDEDMEETAMDFDEVVEFDIKMVKNT
jgi:hypothetical protein